MAELARGPADQELVRCVGWNLQWMNWACPRELQAVLLVKLSHIRTDLHGVLGK